MQRAVQRVDPDLVRRLASWRGEPVVTSLYLDVDGLDRPVAAAYEQAFEQLADEGRRRARSWPYADVVHTVEGDLEAMRTWIARGIDRATTRGVALFSCQAQGRFEAVDLPVPVRDLVAIGPTPRIRQLVEAREPEPFILALVDRTHLRLFRVLGHGVDELPAAVTHQERAVDDSTEVGSFERRDEEAAHAHVRRAVAELEEAVQASAVRIVVGGPDEPVAELERRLRPDTRARIAGRADVSLAAPLEEIASAARAVAERADQQRRAVLVDDLLQRAAGAAPGTVVGLDATLTALAEQRVGTLFVKEGFWAPGVRCTSCSFVGLDHPRCPLCGTPIEMVDDVVEAAIERAIAQHAEVEFWHGPELDAFGGIAAIERY